MSSRVVLLLLLVTALALESDAVFFFGFGQSHCGVLPNVYGVWHFGCMFPYTSGKTCNFRCRPGFVPVSGDAEVVPRTCQADGTWSGDSFTCRRNGFFFFFGKK